MKGKACVRTSVYHTTYTHTPTGGRTTRTSTQSKQSTHSAVAVHPAPSFHPVHPQHNSLLTAVRWLRALASRCSGMLPLLPSLLPPLRRRVSASTRAHRKCCSLDFVVTHIHTITRALKAQAAQNSGTHSLSPLEQTDRRAGA